MTRTFEPRRRVSEPKKNCFTLNPNQLVFTVGIEVLTLASGRLGVTLVKRGKTKRGVALAEARHDLVERGRLVRTAWHTEHNVLCPEDERSPRQILLRVSCLREAHLLRGYDGATIAFATRHEVLAAGEPVSRQKKDSSCLVVLPYDDYRQPHHFPALRLLTRGRRPIVVGLTTRERDPHGQPILWVQDERDYELREGEAARALDHRLLRWTK